MKDALSDPELYKKSTKTLDNAFIELEPTAVFHYTYGSKHPLTY